MEQNSSSLRRELLDLDVDDVVRPRTDGAPPGSRGIDLAAAAQLIVSLQGSAEAVKPAIEAVRMWVARGRPDRERSAELTIGDKSIKLTGVSVDQQDRLIDQFVLSLMQK